MTREAPDQRLRDAALDPARSFIVQAPAGSGKTGLLIQRYLALLATVDRPEEVVAVTFTRKAAGEMRERVLRALGEVEGAFEGADAGDPLGDAHTQRTRELARRVRRRDAARRWHLKLQPGRLSIQTIDALCASLVRRMPWVSRLGGDPEIVEDARTLYRRAARNIVAQLDAAPWAEAAAAVLAHLDNDVPRLETMLVDMLARRDQWLRHVGGAFADPRLRREHLEAGLARTVGDELAALRESVPTDLAPSIVELAAHAAETLAAAGVDSPIRACRNLAELPGASVEALPAWRGLAALLLTTAGTWRRQHTAEHGLPKTKGPDAERVRVLAKQLRAALSSHETFREQLAEVRRLPPAAYTEGQWRVLEALAELLKAACAELRVTFAERGQVDFTEVAQAAVLALGEEEAPSDLALSLDYRIGHILVDEFQDTSHAQFDLLRRLTAGWMPGDGRTLFLVGDPMQSIYRFREADVGLYLRAWEAGVGDVRLTPLRLEANFRAAPSLVDWTNRVFSDVFPPRGDVSTGAVGWSASRAVRSGGGHRVGLHPVVDGDAHDEARTVVRVVAESLGAGAEQVAVLVRSRASLSSLLPRLRDAGIPFGGVEIEPLAGRPLVQDLLALTRALLHPGDRVAWLAVLRAPWCGLTLEELLQVAGGAEQRAPGIAGSARPEMPVLERLRDRGCRDALGADGRARVERVLDVLEPALAARGRRSLRAQVEGVWCALGGPACITGVELRDAEAYLELLERLEPAEPVEPGALTQRVGELFAAAESPEEARVQVMTIHKAKGLEFDTVIVPGLGEGAGEEGEPLLAWAERLASSGESDLLLAPVAAAGEGTDPIFEYLRWLDRMKSRHENARLLYVAATRACERLHLIGRVATSEAGAVRRPRSGTLLACLWDAADREWRGRARARAGGASVRESRQPWPRGAPSTMDPGSPRETAGSLLRRLPAVWRRPDPPADAPWADRVAESAVAGPDVIEFEWAGQTARHVGTVVHRALRVIARDGMAGWDPERLRARHGAWRAALSTLGVEPGELGVAVARVEAALRNVLCDPVGRWILDGRHGEAHSEYALTGVVRGRIVSVVIDRTFVDLDSGDVRWIVDFKTGLHEGADVEDFLDRERARYRGQLERYAALMAAVDARPQRLGLYFPLLAGWRSWAPSGTESEPAANASGLGEGSLV